MIETGVIQLLLLKKYINTNIICSMRAGWSVQSYNAIFTNTVCTFLSGIGQYKHKLTFQVRELQTFPLQTTKKLHILTHSNRKITFYGIT